MIKCVGHHRKKKGTSLVLLHHQISRKMETKKTRSLTRKEHGLFLNEASLLLKEVAFFEDSLEDLKFCTIGNPKKSLQVAKFVCETR